MAVRLGRVNVDAMLRSLTAKQFVEWECYSRLEPIGEIREDARAALVASMVYNMAVDPRHRKDANDPMFQIKWAEKKVDEGKPKQDQFAVMRVLAAAYSSDVPLTPKEQAADEKISAEMREQVARAHAAMIAVKGNA